MMNDGGPPEVFIVCTFFPRPFLESMRKFNFMPGMVIFHPLVQSLFYEIEPELRNYVTGVEPFFVSHFSFSCLSHFS